MDGVDTVTRIALEETQFLLAIARLNLSHWIPGATTETQN